MLIFTKKFCLQPSESLVLSNGHVRKVFMVPEKFQFLMNGFSKPEESVPGLLKFRKKIVSRSSKVFTNSEQLITTFIFSNESEDE